MITGKLEEGLATLPNAYDKINVKNRYFKIGKKTVKKKKHLERKTHLEKQFTDRGSTKRNESSARSAETNF
jgi:hypothetical protein